MAAFNEDDLAAHIEDTEASDNVDELRQQFDFMARFGNKDGSGDEAETGEGNDEESGDDEPSDLPPHHGGGKRGVMKRMSMLERAAHEETIAQLLEMFPDWKHGDMEAVFSSCGDKMQETVEEVMRLGEHGHTSMESSAKLASVRKAGGGGAAGGGESAKPLVNLADQMSRGQLDDYERHVIDHLGETAADETMTIAITVPPGAKPGGAIRVAMVDGSEYNVKIPDGVGPGQKFLAVFPMAPMRAAAAVQLGREGATHDLDAFLAAVDEGGAAGAAADEDDEMAAALAASAVEHAQERARAKTLAEAEDEHLKSALVESAIEDEAFAD